MNYRVCILLLILGLVSCKTASPVVGTIHNSERDNNRLELLHDTTYIYHQRTIRESGDSVFIHDSIYNERVIDHFIHDSIDVSTHDTLTVEVPAQLTRSQQFLIRSGVSLWAAVATAILIFVVFVTLKLTRKI